MIRVFLKRLRDNRGFTLVELLVVVGIIAILAAVLVPRMTGYAERARVSRAMSDLATMKSIIEAYRAGDVSDSYPSKDKIGDELKKQGVNWTGDADGIKDPWDSAYHYYVKKPPGADAGKFFILASFGPDKAIGGGDDVYCTETQAPTKGTLSNPGNDYDEAVSYSSQ